MFSLRIPKAVLYALLTVAVLALSAGTRGWFAPNGRNLTLPMAPPAFVSAASSTSPIADRLDQEAGMSAWFKSNDPINLANAAAAFRVIETQTADYIIGSVAVTGYPEAFDAHVYVHKDGWILAYYLKGDPASKIIDIQTHGINSTTLQIAIATVAGASGVPLGTIQYYDFLYPSATHMLLVFEDGLNGKTFTIKLPGTYGYYERGFSYIDRSSDGHLEFAIDGNNMPKTYQSSASSYGSYGYGVVSASNLLTDITHTIDVTDDGALMVIYREQ